MDSTTFERLLYEEESTTLDFKGQQYRFAKASEEEKAELVKDILGFANAWRRADAYILIGVDEVRGGRANVKGIAAADHLDDHSLQQFVTGLTNRPIRFQYEAFGFDGKQVGIIRIEQQPRPFFLKKDYGKLERNEVYVRRGSSTDPTSPASPDEVAQMGLGGGSPHAELNVEFADVDRDDSLGGQIARDTEFAEMPPAKEIPDLDTRSWGSSIPGFNLAPLLMDPLHRGNKDYFRELAAYEFVRRLFRPLRIVVRNMGGVAAHRVRVELTVPANGGGLLIEPHELPKVPRESNDILHHAALMNFRPAIRREPGEVTIDRNDDRIRVEIDCGDLQPGRRVWSDILYAGRRDSGLLSLHGHVFAENLPKPEEVSLAISFNVAKTRLTVDELTSLPEENLEE